MTLKSWFANRFRTPTLGERGERQAARFLRRSGLNVVATRRRLRYGEIDIVAVDGQTVVFVEVKTRRAEVGVTPAEAVDALRRRRMSRAAIAFLKARSSGPNQPPPRYPPPPQRLPRRRPRPVLSLTA